MTWVVVVVNVIFLFWIVAGLASTGTADASCVREAANNPFLNKSDCEAASAAGAAIGAGIILFLWVMVDFILGVIWLVTGRKKTRECPVCGSDVKKGLIVCKSCGYDFATQQRPAVVAESTS